MSNPVFRNKMSPPIGTSPVSLTALRASPSGPSAFTGPSGTNSLSTAGATVVADPSGAMPSVVQVTPGALAARVDWAPSDKGATKVSTSFRVMLSQAPNATAPHQFGNLQAAIVDPATGTVGSQQTVLALNWVKGTSTLQIQRGTSSYTNVPGVTLTAAAFITLNAWIDLGVDANGAPVNLAGVAVYDQAGVLLGTKTWTDVALTAQTGMSFVAGQWGKANTGDTGATMTMSAIAVDFGEAKDLGFAPSMAVTTAPVIDNIAPQEREGGERIHIAARVKPTTAGATAGSISTTTVGVYLWDGATPHPDAPLLTFAPPAVLSATNPTSGKTVTILASQNQEAVAPKLKQSAVYALRTTGSDSTGLSAAPVTHKVWVKAHPVWLDGKPATLTPGTGAK